MKKLFIGCITVITVLMGLAGCNSERTTYEGPNYLMFSDTLYRYAVQETEEVFNVPVSATVLADYDRTFAVEVVDSISDAVEGKHYKLLSNTVTIKAGECSANVQVQGIYDRTWTVHTDTKNDHQGQKGTSQRYNVSFPNFCNN